MRRIQEKKTKPSGKIKNPPEAGVSCLDMVPAFSLQYIQKSHCISKCEKEEKIAFVDAILKRSEMTWSQIFKSPHDKLGSEIIRRIKQPKPSCAEGKEIISIRFHNQKPMVGFRDREVFYILWFDRAFDVYDHG